MLEAPKSLFKMEHRLQSQVGAFDNFTTVLSVGYLHSFLEGDIP